MIKDIEVILGLKLNKLLLNSNLDSIFRDYIENKISIRNVLTFYHLIDTFKVLCVSKTTFNYIERCFTMLAESLNFLELNIDLVKKVLASSHLRVTSETEVFHAADAWINYKVEERSMFSKNLLLKVRLSLIPDNALDYHLNNSLSFCKSDECVAIINKCLQNKDKKVQNKPGVKYTKRFSNQNNYIILLCGGWDYTKEKIQSKVNQIDASNFESVKALTPMNRNFAHFKGVCLKGEVYIFSGSTGEVYPDTFMALFEKYSPVTNSWSKVADMCDDREDYCVCAMANKIYVVGGCYNSNNNYIETNSCMVFDIDAKNWNEIAGMNQARRNAACVVFEEKVVVSGGDIWTENIEEDGLLNTVESYDYIADTWSSMPNMYSRIKDHSLVVVKNKLFVIGRKKFELYDNNSKCFLKVKLPKKVLKRFREAVSFGDKIYIFNNYDNFITCYDVIKNEWSKISCQLTDNYFHYGCFLLPSY